MEKRDVMDDRARFSEVLAGECSRLRSLARILCVGDENLADDLVQDTCAVALERGPRSITSSLAAWCRGVLRIDTESTRGESVDAGNGRRRSRERERRAPRTTARFVSRTPKWSNDSSRTCPRSPSHTGASFSSGISRMRRRARLPSDLESLSRRFALGIAARWRSCELRSIATYEGDVRNGSQASVPPSDSRPACRRSPRARLRLRRARTQRPRRER